MRSLARRYKDAIRMVEEKSGIVQDTTQQRELIRKVNALMYKEAEQRATIEAKQEQLNTLQMELDRADVIVVKTNYMSHAQYYKVIDRARKKNKRIVYWPSSVEELMKKVGKHYV